MAFTLNSKNGIISLVMTVIIGVVFVQVVTSIIAGVKTVGVVSTLVNLIPVFIILGLILLILSRIDEIKERGRELVEDERWKYPRGRR